MRLRLEEYDYEIQYKKEKENQVADTLSRLHPLKITSEETFTNKIKIRDLVKEFDEWKVTITTRKIPVNLTANHRTWTLQRAAMTKKTRRPDQYEYSNYFLRITQSCNSYARTNQ